MPQNLDWNDNIKKLQHAYKQKEHTFFSHGDWFQAFDILGLGLPHLSILMVGYNELTPT